MKKGFTLIESLFVIAIMMVILLVVVPNITSKNKVVKDKGCEMLLETINSNIVMYEIQYGELPNSIDELISQGLLKENQRTCPNDASIYISDGQAYAS
ncbi:MAG: competence type IV pilus major pilin ComGC [Beduini sp.]